MNVFVFKVYIIMTQLSYEKFNRPLNDFSERSNFFSETPVSHTERGKLYRRRAML